MTANRRYLAIGLAVLAVVVVVLAVVLWPRGSSNADAVSPTSSASTDAPSTTPAPTPVSSDSASTPADAAPGEPVTDAATQKIVASVIEIEADQQHTDPVTPGVPAEPVPGVHVAVESAEPVEGEAHGPGEVAGPAFAVTVSVENATGAPVSLDGVVINVYGTDGAAGSVLASDPRGSPVHGDLAPGATAAGTYVLTRPGDANGSYVISVSLGADAQTVLVTLPPKAG